MNGFGSMLKDYLEYYKISQTEFADRLNISQKHMNEIINGKTSISTELILAISLLTNIDANLIYQVENKRRISEELNKRFNEKELKEYLNSFSIKEMADRKWIKLRDKSSLIQNYIDLNEFINLKDINNLDSFLEKRFLFKKTDNSDNKKIYLWIRHCDLKTNGIEVCEYDSSKLDNLFEELIVERNKKFDINSLVNIFKKYGIILYVEDALKGSKVRGAIKVKINTPYIYMTKYYKEKSSFYYCLYHELAHLKHDYNKLKNKVVIENDEKNMNLEALNLMIPEDIYDKILNDYDNKDLIAKENNIPLCFLYTRLAYDKKISYKSKEYLNNIEKI